MSDIDMTVDDPEVVDIDPPHGSTQPVVQTEVELADDGSPLGTLKVDGKIYARDPMGDLKRVAETEVRRSRSLDLVEDDGADPELLDMYEGFDDKDKRRQALERYVRDGLTASIVAQEVGVPERTVLMWAYHGKWNRAASHELSVRMEEEARALVNLRLRHRERLLTQQVMDAMKMQKRLMEKVDSDEISMKSAAESLAALAKVQNAAMGVADSGSVVTDPQKQEDNGGKGSGSKVLVAVFPGMSGIPTLGKKEEAVDVEAN